MECIKKKKSGLDELDKNEINEDIDSIKTFNSTKEDNSQKEKFKVDSKQVNIANLPSNNFTTNNIINNSNYSQNSFPLLFK